LPYLDFVGARTERHFVKSAYLDPREPTRWAIKLAASRPAVQLTAATRRSREQSCLPTVKSETRLAPRSCEKNQRDRGDADQTNDKNVVVVSDKTKPAKGVADIGVAAVRATDGELARTTRARALPTKQGIWQLKQRGPHEMQLRIKRLLAVRARFHRGLE
jgi:hypothetical protein